MELVPGGAASAIARPRSTTALTAASGVSAPVTQVAVYSPTEWPAAADGWMPRRASSRASAGPMKRSAGWAFAVSLSSSSSASVSRRRRSTPAPSPQRSASSLISRSSNSSAPIPLTWEPCPGKRKATANSGRLLGGAAGRERLGLSARLERLDPTLDGGQGPAQVRFQVLQLFQRVGLRLPDRLVSARLRLAHCLLSQAFGTVQHLVLLNRRLRPLVGPAQYPARLRVRLGDQPLLLLHRPVGLLDLVGQVEAELVDHLHQLVRIHHHLVGEGDVPRVMDHELQAVKDFVDLQLNLSSRRLATGTGTKSLTSLPWLPLALRVLCVTK